MSIRQNVFESYERATATNLPSERHRVYRVRQGERVLFAHALSPRDAVGQCAESLGIQAKLADATVLSDDSETSLRERIATLPPQKLREVLADILSRVTEDASS